MSVESFGLPRESTLQFNDVYGPLPVDGLSIPPPDDFDAVVTSVVRNTGGFQDREFAISDGGGVLGNYATVLVDDLRHQQREQAMEVLDGLGVTDIADLSPEQRASVHPDDETRLRSLETAVVAVVNEAPRTSDHHQTGQNGNDFYVATTNSGVEVYGQAHLLSSLDARGRIETLHRVPNGRVWPEGEQFRSSVVSDARRHPEVLEEVPRDENWPVPVLPDGTRLAYADKFGNVRVETSDIHATSKVLSGAERVDLVLEDGQVAIGGLHVVSRLTDIPEGDVGVYVNPADREVENGPGYLEIVRRVSDPNGDTQPRAYHQLAENVGALLGKDIKFSDWDGIVMNIVPSAEAAEPVAA
jgi:hypothetical protein